MTVAVRLRDRMLDKVDPYVDPNVLPVFHHDVTQVSPFTLEIVAPYVAWEMLVESIAERMMTRGARPNQHHTNMLKGMLARISKSLTVVMVHPALKGRGKAGDSLQDGVFPAWSQPPDNFGRIWSPTPNGGEYRLLKPHIEHDMQLGQYTLWDQFGHARRHWCHDPEVHVAVSERRALPSMLPAPRRDQAPPGVRRQDPSTG